MQKTFAYRLTYLRKLNGYSQKALAAELGIHCTTIWQWEDGRHNANVCSPLEIADFFGVSYLFLLGNSEELPDGYIEKAQNAAFARRTPRRSSFNGVQCAAFGKRFKELRLAKGWSRQRLARKLFVCQGSIIQWETGKSAPRLYSYQQLADLFGVSKAYLLGQTDTKN